MEIIDKSNMKKYKMNREQKDRDCYKQTLKEIQQIILNIRNDEDFVGEGKLWQMVFDIEKIISRCEVQNDKM